MSDCMACRKVPVIGAAFRFARLHGVQLLQVVQSARLCHLPDLTNLHTLPHVFSQGLKVARRALYASRTLTPQDWASASSA